MLCAYSVFAERLLKPETVSGLLGKEPMKWIENRKNAALS